MWEGNWLAGVYGGLAEREGDLDVFINHPLGLSTNYINAQEDTGFIGGVLGGYQVRCHEWLLGGELNFEWQDLGEDQESAFTDARDVGIRTTARYYQNQVAAISGRFGYEVFPNFLPYVRLGVQTSRDKLVVFGTDTDYDESIDMESLRRVWRLTAGIGAEIPACLLMGLSLRAEYNYRARAGSINTEELAIDNQTVVTGSMRPKAHAVLVAFVLNFV